MNKNNTGFTETQDYTKDKQFLGIIFGIENARIMFGVHDT